MTSAGKHQNRLAQETSPYLLQHATNPVDWYPWGPEALERAKREDRPILLSIGYAACHWCHVMERESFEDEATARLMNEHFVCIKVDREERPDLDDVYMTATVAMTGHGGWPMTVFLTPEQEPFFAGTYFPPKDAHGRPGFPTLLSRISELWQTKRAELAQQAKELVEHVRGRSETVQRAAVGEDAIQGAAGELLESLDAEHGGFGGAPKFPPSQALSLLLRLHRKIPDPTLLEMVTKTLDAMKNGGIYDHVGGGFARYSTDERWLVPHFEKMLYDNAQLARVYLEAWQVTKNPEYRRIATETLDYVVREMQGADGGYFSATDADSEGVEGKFFVWSLDEIVEVLGQPAAEQFCHHYDVTGEGNWEGTNVLNTPRTLEESAKDLGVLPDALARALAEAREKLHEARLRRVPPLLDDKVLASWNGLMISAMAEGARVLRVPRYLDSATRAARFALTALRRPDGGLFRTARAGKAHLDAYLEDYAFLADGLVDLYEAGGAPEFLEEARRLGARLTADFGDAESGAFFQTAHRHEALITRGREGHDGAIPSGNAVAARALARLGHHFGDALLRERALAAVSAHGRAVERSPRAFATALGVVDLLLEGPVELAIVGEPGRADTEAILAAVADVYLPNRIVSHGAGSPSELPLLAGKTLVSGHAALCVCRDFACQSPVTNPAQVKVALGQAEAALSESRARVVGVRRLPGSATPEGTRAYAARFAQRLGAGAFVPLAKTDLVVSRFGFGTYRVDDRVDTHREALRHALTEGVNLVDTSTNYGDGHSEKLVGEVLADLAKAGKVPREAVVVVSKIGYAQGENLDLVLEREEAGKPFPDVVKYAEGLAHCIHPEWLADQLGRSLDRLGLETLDVCLLHNPEYFLSHAAKERMPLEEARTEFHRRIGDAFRHLELEVSRGRLRYYGVSSNSVGEPAGAAETTDLSRMLEAARAVAGDAHHFRVLQLPLNVLEPGAALEKNTGPARETALEFAAKNGISVLVNRPLNAIVGDKLVRLADPPDLPEAPRVGDQIEKVRALEQEFLKAFGPMLRPPPGSKTQLADLFRWADQLGDLAAHIESYEQFRNVETGQIAPRVMAALSSVGSALQGPPAQKFHAFQERYVTELEALLAGLRRRAADRSKARSLAIARGLDPSLPEGMRVARLSQKSLAIVASLPGVTTVLVGMRDPEYVHDVVPAMGWERVPDARKVLEAARGIEIR
ncbi:MAG TPA: aldo/keto reductase [Polyangiaceae bacterium]|nr:aldo/keto reductase [Polyangiaceae bacterium]